MSVLRVDFFKASRLFVLVFCSLIALVIDAEEPIAIFAISGGNPPLEIQVSSSNIIDLVDRVTERQAEFVAFAGRSFEASLNYLGVENAVVFEFSADGRTAVVSIPAADFQQTFTAEDAAGLSGDLEDFFTFEGTKQIAELRKIVNQLSPAGVSDGNPFSTTALLSANWLTAFRAMPDLGSARGVNNGLSFDFSTSSYNAGNFNGTLHRGAFGAYRNIFEKARVLMTLPFNYHKIGESEIFGAGAGVAVPYELIRSEEVESFGWVVAPYFGGMFRISEDLASGGAMLDYGLHSRLSYKLREDLGFSGLVQVEDYTGLPLAINNFELDSKIEQELVTLGVESDYQLREWVVLSGHLYHNQYLKDAGVRNWLEIGVDLQAELLEQVFFNVSYERLEANRFGADTLRGALSMTF